MSKKETKKEHNRMYKLYELKDNLTSAITNMENVIKQNGLLVESVINSKNKEALKDLTEGLVKDCKYYTEKIDEYKVRLSKLESLIAMYEAKDEKSDFVVSIISTLIESFGLDAEPENYPTKA